MFVMLVKMNCNIYIYIHLFIHICIYIYIYIKHVYVSAGMDNDRKDVNNIYVGDVDDVTDKCNVGR